MNKTLILASLVGALGIASAASADRGYGHRGGDRYAAQRYEASARYGHGSRNYDSTYGRYGQATYGLRTNYDRDYHRRYDAGYRYYGGRPSYSSFSFGFFGGGGYRDSVSLGFGYSSGPTYYRPAPVYRYPTYYCPPPVVYVPESCAPSYYAAPSYGSGFYFRGYYGR